MSNDRIERIERLLNARFQPSSLQVKDQSHLHAGHEGAKDGRGHFDVKIVADDFRDLSRIECHRLVYDALDEMMKTDIHALRITASAK